MNIQKVVINISNYLITHYKGVYRLKVQPDQYNQFPRKLDGSFEDIDVYIDCAYQNKIFYYGKNTLQAYIPSIGRGHNIINSINEKYGNVIFDIEETDVEILFKFKTKDADNIIPFLRPKTSGASISPFSSKNLPKNKTYKIPEDELSTYNNLIKNIPKNERINLVHMTKNFLKSLTTNKNTWEDIKADMQLKGLKGKEYIHSIGKWKEYIKYLNDNLEEGVNEK